MTTGRNTIAIIFDFDDALTGDSLTQLLLQHALDPRDFCARALRKRTESGWDPSLAYLATLLEETGYARPFGRLTNASLRAFGGTLQFHPGLPKLFDDLRDAAREYADAEVQFYTMTTGLEEIVRGS